MNKEQYFYRFKHIQESDLELAKKKNHDYAGDDPLYNFKTFGFDGIIVRMNDKMCRLINFVKNRALEVSDESIIDTLRDIRVYSTIAEIQRQEEKTKGRDSANSYQCPHCGYKPKSGDILEAEDKDLELIICPKCNRRFLQTDWEKKQ